MAMFPLILIIFAVVLFLIVAGVTAFIVIRNKNKDQ